VEQVLACILNDKSGSNRVAEAQALISQVAAKRGWEARVLIYSGGTDLNSLVDQARAVGGLVVGGGGDGTIAAVAAALVSTDTPLACCRWGPSIIPSMLPVCTRKPIRWCGRHETFLPRLRLRQRGALFFVRIRRTPSLGRAPGLHEARRRRIASPPRCSPTANRYRPSRTAGVDRAR
jgi:hypothetical protein